MTEIRMERGGGRYALTARGHATGSPQVCAAISALVYALAGYLENVRGTVQVGESRLDSGDARLCWSGGTRAEAAYELAAVGLCQLAKRYPRYVACSVDETEGGKT